MAHLEKYKKEAVWSMLAHYKRTREGTLERENIDREKTHLNYTVGFNPDGKLWLEKGVPEMGSYAEVKRRMERSKAETKRAIRKDAVILADWVVTLPPNVKPEDEQKFFAFTYCFVAEKVGRENLLGGYVHKDEKTPHIHIPFTPIVKDRFCFKKLCTRQIYMNFHEELGKYLEGKLGYLPEVELSEERELEKFLSKVPQEDLEEARRLFYGMLKEEEAQIKREIKAKKTEREQVKKDLADAREVFASEKQEQELKLKELEGSLTAHRQLVADEKATLAEVKAQIEDENDRLECLRLATQYIERIAGRLDELTSCVWATRKEGRRERSESFRSIADRCATARREFSGLLEKFRERLETGHELVPEIPLEATRTPLERPITQNSLSDLGSEARAASRALESSNNWERAIKEPRDSWER